jgi:hypothetical protein
VSGIVVAALDRAVSSIDPGHFPPRQPACGLQDLDRPVVQTAAMNAVPSFAPSSLAGKWTLELVGAGSCVMNFTVAARRG